MPSRLASVKEAARNRLRTAIPWATILTYQPIEWDRYPVATIQWRSENIIRVGLYMGAGPEEEAYERLDEAADPDGITSIQAAILQGETLADTLESIELANVSEIGLKRFNKELYPGVEIDFHCELTRQTTITIPQTVVDLDPSNAAPFASSKFKITRPASIPWWDVVDITNLNMIAERDPTSLKAWATSQPLHLSISRAVPNESRAEQDARIIQSEIEELSTPYEIYNGRYPYTTGRPYGKNLETSDGMTGGGLTTTSKKNVTTAPNPAPSRQRAVSGVYSEYKVEDVSGTARFDPTGIPAGWYTLDRVFRVPMPAQISGGRRTYRVLACIATDSDSTQKLAPRMGWTWGYLRDSYYGPYYHIPDLPEADDGLFKDAGEYAEPPKIIPEGEWKLVELGQIEHRSRLPYSYAFRGVAIVPLFYFDDQLVNTDIQYRHMTWLLNSVIYLPCDRGHVLYPPDANFDPIAHKFGFSQDSAKQPTKVIYNLSGGVVSSEHIRAHGLDFTRSDINREFDAYAWYADDGFDDYVGVDSKLTVSFAIKQRARL